MSTASGLGQSKAACFVLAQRAAVRGKRSQRHQPLELVLYSVPQTLELRLNSGVDACSISEIYVFKHFEGKVEALHFAAAKESALYHVVRLQDAEASRSSMASTAHWHAG